MKILLISIQIKIICFQCLRLIKQPTQISLNKIPRHLDREFWGNGNSYFFNCLLAGFRKEIKNYELINENDLKNEVIFSINYYRNKKLMNDTEIEKFLYKKSYNS